MQEKFFPVPQTLYHKTVKGTDRSTDLPPVSTGYERGAHRLSESSPKEKHLSTHIGIRTLLVWSVVSPLTNPPQVTANYSLKTETFLEFLSTQGTQMGLLTRVQNPEKGRTIRTE
jgi:hypothetical protein